jgi:MFS family permease
VLGGAASQWPLGALSDRIDRRYVMAICASLGFAASLAILAFGERLPAPGIVLLSGLWGAAAFPLYSISVAHSNDHAAQHEFVAVSSGLLLMYGIGAIIGPLLASGLMQLMGARGLYAFTGTIHLSLLGYLFVRRYRRSPVAPEEQSAFATQKDAAKLRRYF